MPVLLDVQRCLDAGMNAHLAKPLDIEKVKKTICEHTIELYNKEDVYKRQIQPCSGNSESGER